MLWKKGSRGWRPPSAQGNNSLIYSLSATAILPMRKNATGFYPITTSSVVRAKLRQYRPLRTFLRRRLTGSPATEEGDVAYLSGSPALRRPSKKCSASSGRLKGSVAHLCPQSSTWARSAGPRRLLPWPFRYLPAGHRSRPASSGRRANSAPEKHIPATGAALADTV